MIAEPVPHEHRWVVQRLNVHAPYTGAPERAGYYYRVSKCSGCGQTLTEGSFDPFPTEGP